MTFTDEQYLEESFAARTALLEHVFCGPAAQPLHRTRPARLERIRSPLN
jgi:hypothetical protein